MESRLEYNSPFAMAIIALENATTQAERYLILRDLACWGIRVDRLFPEAVDLYVQERALVLRDPNAEDDVVE